VQHRLQTSHNLLGKEGIHSRATKAVVPMVHGPETRFIESKLVDEKLILVSQLMLRIELLIIVWIINVELVRTNSNDWAYT
jgi:hypothetical protein